MKSVSVHIVTYNSEKYVDDCLNAVYAQSYPIERIIVVDNASIDGTRACLDNHASRIDILLNNQNVGFAAAHNLAIRRSNSDYCLVLNPDVTLHPDYVCQLIGSVEAIDSTRRIGSLTGKLLLASDPRIVDSCGLTINKARRAFDLGQGQPSELWTKRLEVFGVSGAAALYARDMIKDISISDEFFDEAFFAYKEDVDVAWRAQLYGWGAYFVPEAIGYHERGWKAGGRKAQPLFVRKLSYINRYRMMVKNDSIGAVIKHMLPLACYEGAAFLYTLIREPKLLGAWKTLVHDRVRLNEWRTETKSHTKTKNVYTYFH